jgi:fumarylpyruvate hydrolase
MPLADPRYVIPPPPVVSLPVEGGDDRFPVRRVYCVGRNYAAHAREMGHDPDREPPFFFLKPADALVTDGADAPYPPASEDVHHEIELVVALGAGGRDIPAERALDLVFGYAVGLDLTRRDRQGEAKALGRPWEVGKAFDASAPCGTVAPAGRIGHPDTGAITLDVDGARRQAGDLAQMIWRVPEVIAHLSGLFALHPGDLVFTGTPAGVGPIHAGTQLTGRVEGVGEVMVRIV